MISKLTINDIFLGQKLTYRRLITEELIKQFSVLTSDFHPLHTDHEYSVKNGFKGVIAQGFLLTSFMSFVVGMKMPGENALILSQESRFIKPVYINNDILIECEVTFIDPRFSVFTLTYNGVNEKKERVISGSVKVKIRKEITQLDIT